MTMVSNVTIASMIGFILYSFLLFAGFILFNKRRTGISIKPLIVGSVGFIVITQVLEKLLHLVVITQFPNYADHPVLFGIYGGLAAGIFEEVGRFILFTWLLKKYLDYKGGLSFGIGWGGIEAVVLALTMTLPNIIFSFMINSGTFDTAMAAQFPSDQISMIKETILSQNAAFYLLGVSERFFALFLQIALSLFVLVAVIKKKKSYLIYAILIHAAIDFPFVFIQTGHFTSLWVLEIYLAVIGILSIFFIKKMKKSLQ
ncbi:YhfC family intramembrane metalloprotease [Niallia endozanthoxylica]|uniref:YhfC family intramembrane metalloprotease n=2 Tax=Niallia endozanthoxylica TaxID=2036016 RepID=A0A5J5HZ30_9BACI|nr:YhfC family intramembrane metalloprotease [Niallia endozanthoxylica]